MTRWLAIFLLALSLSSCGSIINLTRSDGGYIYGGIYIDITGCPPNESDVVPLWRHPGIGWMDFPFSLVVDTLALPYCIVCEILR